MTQIQFGVGTAIGRRTDISNPTPAFLGILQDIDVSIDQTLKELMGAYKMPVDVAPAALKITGKAKLAKIQANFMNDTLLGETITTASGVAMAVGEAGTIPASSVYTVVVTHSATFVNDLGVFYASSGAQLKCVASGPTVGQYSVSAGTYTFAAADAGLAVTIYYDYTVTTLNQISGVNQLMGSGPSFELNLQNTYKNNAGTTNSLYIKLNACRSSKLSLPFKNGDYLIQEFDFTAFADQSNNWGSISTTE